MHDELLGSLALIRTPGIGPVTARNVLAHFRDMEAIRRASPRDLMQAEGIGPAAAQHIIRMDKYFAEAEKELTFCEKHGIVLYRVGDAHYPARLAECHDAPFLLFFRGTSDLNAPRILSVVGTRKPTPYGEELARRLVEALADAGVLVISGLALGVDTLAHRTALAHHIPTLGVMAHGFSQVYPASNREMAVAMLAEGGLLSEYSSEEKPNPTNFPARNRIIAGMCDALVVVESAENGGGMITANLAND